LLKIMGDVDIKKIDGDIEFPHFFRH